MCVTVQWLCCLGMDAQAQGVPTLVIESQDTQSAFHWTAKYVVLSIFLFVAAGVCEIGGGWLVWKAIRSSKPWWWALLGSVVLIGYGFIPTAQPTASFGRVYAVYGGFFIVLSYLWGWALDGDQPDIGKETMRFVSERLSLCIKFAVPSCAFRARYTCHKNSVLLSFQLCRKKRSRPIIP